MANSLSRTEKLENISGEKYPRDFPGREPISNIIEDFNLAEIVSIQKEREIELPETTYKIAGRISARRDHGDNLFFDIFDQTDSIQLHGKRYIDSYDDDGKILEEDTGVWPDIQELDTGDMVGVEGTLGANPRGEPLLLISNFILLAKALKDPPANFHGVKNLEHKYRHREQDLLSSAETREVFKERARIVFEIRKYLNALDYIEIECPVLQPIYGGATARPFRTQHNALGQDFFLSISSELYIKRAMVGGFDRVYSFSRCFRNEGISPEHNPEFTNLEIFETCKTEEDMRDFVDVLIDHTAHSIGSLLPEREWQDDLPAQDWPLSRDIYDSKSDNYYAEAWELYINDMEIASGASDLNDPREQGARLKKSERKSEEFSEARYSIESSREEEGKPIDFTPQYDEEELYDPYDKNYIEALEMGALPWAGVGIGIDRLCMLLLRKNNIRDVLLFPLLKDKK